MNSKNLFILALLGVGVYFIFFNKKNLNQVQNNADTNQQPKAKKGGCGCSKNKTPEVAPEL